ncbi:MAG: hypothetical protein PUA54_02010 [Coprococcus catus]|nr:hypothetical protein [Coprococcus catus]
MELKTEILIIGGGVSGMAAACVIREMVSEWRLRRVRKWKATLPWKRQHRRLRDMMR